MAAKVAKKTGRGGGSGKGRAKGTPNKAKAELLELIRETVEDKNYHPVVAMAVIANDDSTKQIIKGRAKDGTPTTIEVPKYDLELRAKMHQEVARYVAPQLKAVEHKASDSDGQGINFFMGFTTEPVVSRPDVKGNGHDSGNGEAASGNGAHRARPRPRAGQ